jgi:hypothetical protein
MKISEDVNIGVNNTGSKFAASVVDSSGKFSTGVIG